MSSPLPDLSNEQKLTYIYHTLKDQESRRRRAAWYRILKWLLFLVIVYFIAMNPTWIMDKVTTYIKPLVMSQMQGVIEENKNTLMKSIQDLLPANIEIAPTPVVEPPVKQKTSPVKKSGVPI